MTEGQSSHHYSAAILAAQERMEVGAKAAAQSQADAITFYWHAKGHPEVKAWVSYTKAEGYAVISNLVRGLPPTPEQLEAMRLVEERQRLRR